MITRRPVYIRWKSDPGVVGDGYYGHDQPTACVLYALNYWLPSLAQEEDERRVAGERGQLTQLLLERGYYPVWGMPAMTAREWLASRDWFEGIVITEHPGGRHAWVVAGGVRIDGNEKSLDHTIVWACDMGS